jgi:acyl carrier protein
VASQAPVRRPGADALDVVRAAVATVLEVEIARLDAATSFADLEADSLVLVGVADEVEATMGWGDRLRIDDRALADMATLGELAGYVTRQLS